MKRLIYFLCTLPLTTLFLTHWLKWRVIAGGELPRTYLGVLAGLFLLELCAGLVFGCAHGMNCRRLVRYSLAAFLLLALLCSAPPWAGLARGQLYSFMPCLQAAGFALGTGWSMYQRRPRYGARLMLVLIDALLIAQPLSYPPQLMVNQTVYVQKGASITALPPGSAPLGSLTSYRRRSRRDPAEDFTAVNLHPRYDMLYQSGEKDTVIYLEDYSGFFIPFIEKETNPHAK